MPLHSGMRKKNYKKKPAAKSAADKRTTKIARTVAKRVLRGEAESKYWTYPLDSFTVDTTGRMLDLFSLAALPNGTTDTSRTGDTISVKSFHMKGTMTAADNTNLIRVILFAWRPSSGTGTPTVSDLLSASWASNYTLAYKSVDNSRDKEVKVFYDKTFPLISSTDKVYKMFSANVPFPNGHKIQFIGGSSTVAANKFYIYFVSDSSAATHPSLLMNYRFYFTDL